MDAAFRFETRSLNDVSGIRVQEVELMVIAPEEVPVEARIGHANAASPWELTGSITDFARSTVVNARLDVTVTCTTRPVRTTIERVATASLASVADLEAVDGTIITQDGSLPTDESALDARRIEVLGERLRDSLEVPADEFDADDFMSSYGIESATDFVDLFTRRSFPMRTSMDLRIDPTDGFVSEDFRVGLLALIIDDPFAALTDTIEQIQRARGVLARTGRRIGIDSALTPRNAFPFLILFQESALDDEDLPLLGGADPASVPVPDRPASRLAELGNRLRSLAIALAPVSDE